LDLSPDSTTFINLAILARVVTAEQNLLSIFVIIAFLRSLKFLKIPPYTGPAATSILQTMQDNSFVVFILSVSLVIMAIAVAFMTALGPYNQNVSDFGTALLTTVRGAVFGDFDFGSVADSSIGIVLFLIMKLFAATLLLTIFIAVIADSYMKLQNVNSERWEVFITSLLIESIKKRSEKRTILQKTLGRGRTFLKRGLTQKIEFKLSTLQGKEEAAIDEEEEELQVDDDEDPDDNAAITVSFDDGQLDEMILEARTQRAEKGEIVDDIQELKRRVSELHASFDNSLVQLEARLLKNLSKIS